MTAKTTRRFSFFGRPRPNCGVAMNDDESTALAFTGLATACNSQGRYSEAEDYYEKALTSLPSNSLKRAELIAAVAGACQNQEKHEKAESLFRQCLGLDWIDTDLKTIALVGLAASCLKLRKHNEAEQRYREALFLMEHSNPRRKQILKALGAACQQQGRFEEAEAYFREALEVSTVQFHENKAGNRNRKAPMESGTTEGQKSAELKVSRYVNPIHFEDFSGEAFERLVFGFMLRVEWWQKLDWYGQVGSDSGRDIWAVGDNNETLCVQCVNRKKFTKAKAEQDIKKIVNGPHGIPTTIRFICRTNISAQLRDEIIALAVANGIRNTEIWSGQEFEERLRADAESLLQRFCAGIVFPDSSSELNVFVRDGSSATDSQILDRLLNQAFDRPAFTTPFRNESNMADFRNAVTDTIGVLNTGVCKNREGSVFRRIDCRHDLQDSALRKELSALTISLSKLRSAFDELEREGAIRQSGNVLLIERFAAAKMNEIRADILTRARRIYPEFEVDPSCLRDW